MLTPEEAGSITSVPERCGHDISDQACDSGGRAKGGAAEDVSRVDLLSSTRVVQTLNAMNEDIRSLADLDFPSYGVIRPSALVSLSLHSNRVTSLAGLSELASLTALNLSSNELDGEAIRGSAPHLGALSCLTSLDLSCNRIDALLGLPFLPRLSRLMVPYNRLASLDGVQALASSLTYLDARDNRIAWPTGMHAPHLAALGRITSLLLMSPGGGQSNPVCSCPHYREDVLAATTSAATCLQTLDGITVTPDELSRIAAARDGSRARRSSGHDSQGQPQAAEFSEPASGPKNSSHNKGDVACPSNPALGISRGRRAAERQHETAMPLPKQSAPEEVPMPRFETVASQFRQRRHRHGNRRQRLSPPNISDADCTGVERNFARGLVSDSSGDEPLRHEGLGSDDQRGRGGVVKASATAAARPSDRVLRTNRALPDEGADGGLSEDDLDPVLYGDGEDVAEEQGLLGRLRSIAHEARLEVMDSRLKGLQEKQAVNFAAAGEDTQVVRARASAVSARGKSAAVRAGQASNSGSGGNGGSSSSSIGVTYCGRHSSTLDRLVQGRVGALGHVSRPSAPGDGSRRPSEASGTKTFDGGSSQRPGYLYCRRYATGEPWRHAEENFTRSCPGCGARNGQEALSKTFEVDMSANGEPQAQAALESDHWGLDAESQASKDAGGAFNRANRKPTPVSARTSGVSRARPASAGKTGAALGMARAHGMAGVGGAQSMSLGRSVKVAAVAGATAAALVAFDRRRLALCFGRWANETDRMRSTAAVAAAEANLVAVRNDAELERQAWKSLQKALEDSAASREREAKESAEESAREEIRSLASACRSAEETATALQLELAQAEAKAAASALSEKSAQAARQQAETQTARAQADAKAVAAAGAERWEEKLRVQARAQSRAEEECRRVLATLRAVESRCRGLQDEVREARARDERIADETRDARRQAAAEAAERKLALAVDAEREQTQALKLRVGEVETDARQAASAAREASEAEAKAKATAVELAELARQQKVALQFARAELKASQLRGSRAEQVAQEMEIDASKMATELRGLRSALDTREGECGSERRARMQTEEDLKAETARAEAFERELKEVRSEMQASASVQGDLRAAVMVKDKVLEDREKLISELRERERDALAEARGWRDRAEAQQAEVDMQLDAAREEISDLQAQVVALSGVEDQLREVFKELRRYRKRDDDGDHDGRASRRSHEKEGASEMTAVAAVTAAAKAVEQELRDQLATKDEALRYVENELLGMKSVFEGKEASLRRELRGERDKLVGEMEELRLQAEEAAQRTVAAEEKARGQATAAEALRADLRAGDRRAMELERTLRALLVKYEEERESSAKLAQMASFFHGLQEKTKDDAVAPSHCGDGALLPITGGTLDKGRSTP